MRTLIQNINNEKVCFRKKFQVSISLVFHILFQMYVQQTTTKIVIFTTFLETRKI